MKLAAIKALVEKYTHDQLVAAEKALFDEQPLGIDIEGEDDGEKLTHLLAAIFVKDYMVLQQCDYTTAIRAYSRRVRESIS